MRSPLILHTITLLKFYARNRLILAFGLIVLALWALGLVPMLLFDSSGDRFNALKNVSWQMRSFSWFSTAGLGLFAIWSHVTNRNTSLVFTRPVRPETWLGAVFLSAFLVAFAAHLVSAVLTFGLSLVWHIPFTAGFLWMTLDGMMESVIVISVLTAAATVVHPVIAVFAMLFFNESVFYQLDTLLLGFMQARGPVLWLRVLDWLVRGVETVLPMLDPFASRTGAVEGSLRVTPSDWGYLAATAGYAVLAFACFFLFADYFVRRRRTI
jgi:hypothetical protein